MADYRAIKGLPIQVLSSDPSNLNAGQVWYNSTLGKVRGAKLAAGSWASGGNTSSGHWLMDSLFGSQTAAAIAGGHDHTDNYHTETEEYDGSSWTTGNAMQRGAGAGAYWSATGTLTAGLIAGGYHGGPSAGTKDEVEEYDGTNWAEVTDLPAAGQTQGAFGTQTAAVYATGSVGNTSLHYDGTNWTSGGNVNTTRVDSTGNGIQTAGMIVGGEDPSNQKALTETYNGSSWTEAGDLNTARTRLGSTTTGPSSSTIVFGGPGTPAHAITEQWDGTSWTEVGDLSTGRYSIGGCGTVSAGLAACGNLGPGGITGANASKLTEEWTGPAAAASNWDVT